MVLIEANIAVSRKLNPVHVCLIHNPVKNALHVIKLVFGSADQIFFQRFGTQAIHHEKQT